MLVLVFYVPEAHLEKVKNALFDAGAGEIGNYSRCCWQCRGEGQFMPGQGSAPFSGRLGEISSAEEYRVEMVCSRSLASKVRNALLSAHPYETPAWHFIEAAEVIYE